MKKMIFTFLTALLTLSAISAADPAQSIQLPAPDKKGGKPLMQAETERKTTRDYVKGTLTMQMLSDMLYCTCGFNREDKLVIATAMNKQDLTLYVALDNGVYHYLGKENKLELVAAGDHRADMGMQKPMLQSAACVVVYVSDTNQFNKEIEFPAVHTGSASQNLYLFCASQNLGTVVLGSIDRAAIAKLLKLKEGFRVMLTQPVGFVEAPAAAAK